MSENDEPKFDCYAVLEIMGHDRYAGRVSEQSIGGCAFVRVDVPQVGDSLPFTKFFGQGAIFSITPVSEEVAKAKAVEFRSRPITIYCPAIPAQLPFEDDGDDEWGY